MKLFIEDLNVKGKKVIVRVDFNVPLRDGLVESDKRIVASLPTITYLQKQGAKVILMSHLGRPKGKVDPTMSLKAVADKLGELLKQKIMFSSECIGPKAKAAVDSLKNGELLLLENLRFHNEEEANDSHFAKELAGLADIYVNDAFGTAHRAHASTEGITHHISQSACGYLIKKELEFLGDAIAKPKRPFVAIIGGAKISGKIDVIDALLTKVDKLIIGGGMTYTFLKAMGLNIGNSLCEDDKVELARSLLKKAGGKIELPVDCKVTTKFDFKARTIEPLHVVRADSIQNGTESVDIGPEALKKYQAIISEAKTLLWNGPMGVFEIAEASEGTFGVAKALADATAKGAITIIGGGDSAAAIELAGLEDKVTHVSTGGGASLEFLEGKILPGVEALSNK